MAMVRMVRRCQGVTQLLASFEPYLIRVLHKITFGKLPQPRSILSGPASAQLPAVSRNAAASQFLSGPPAGWAEPMLNTRRIKYAGILNILPEIL